MDLPPAQCASHMRPTEASVRGRPQKRRPRVSRPTSHGHHQAAAVVGQIDRWRADPGPAAPSNWPRPWYSTSAGHSRLQLTKIARNHKLRAGRFQRQEPQKTSSGHMLAHDRSLMHERDGIWSHCNHPASFAANPAPRQVTLSQRLVKWRVLVAHQDVVCSPSNAARTSRWMRSGRGGPWFCRFWCRTARAGGPVP